MQAIGILPTDLGLPFPTIILASSARRNGGFGLVTAPFTIAYHRAILGHGLPRIAFTNHYRLAVRIEHNTLDEYDYGVVWCYNALVIKHSD